MSLCVRVATCMVDEAYRVSANIQNDVKNLHHIGLVAVSALFGYVHLYGVNYNFNEDFRVEIIGIQLLATVIAFSPICLGNFVRELTRLSKGPLCSELLGEHKLKTTIQWAVKELTNVASLPDKLKEVFVSKTQELGLCLFWIGFAGLYQAGYMHHHRIQARHVSVVSALSLLLIAYGIIHIFPNSDVVNLDHAFRRCLTSNGTKV